MQMISHCTLELLVKPSETRVTVPFSPVLCCSSRMNNLNTVVNRNTLLVTHVIPAVVCLLSSVIRNPKGRAFHPSIALLLFFGLWSGDVGVAGGGSVQQGDVLEVKLQR